MVDNLESFKIFVNTEIPKRLSTEVDPLSVRPGLVPVSNGTGLSFDLVDPVGLVKVGLVTEHNLVLTPEGTAQLSQRPHGGTIFDMALILLKDDSYLEITGVAVEGSTLVLLPADYLIVKDIAKSVSVTYLGTL